MVEQFFIYSTAYSIRKRELKDRTVYDAIFRVVDSNGVEKQKVLSGYSSKALLKRAHADFLSSSCQIINNRIESQKSVLEFTTIFGNYFKYITSTLKESSCVSIKSKFDMLIIPYFAGKDISKLTKQDYYDWQDKLFSAKTVQGNPYSPYTLRRARGYLVTFLEWVSERYDVPNRLVKLKLPQASVKQAHLNFWDVEEFRTFISCVDDIVYKTFFTTLFYCGCRKGEAMSFADSDFDGDSLHIYKTYNNKTLDGSTFKITMSKEGRNFFVPVAAPLKSQLAEYLDWKKANNVSSEYLFGGDKPLSPETIRRKFKDYVSLSGVKLIRIHDLRHSFASMIIHHGGSYAAVAELIGDNPEQVIRTYGHLYQSDKKKLIDSLI